MDTAWAYSEDHGDVCQILEQHVLWGYETCRIWLPRQNQVVQVAADRLRPLSTSPLSTVEGLKYVAAAARVADALSRKDVLLAPIESSVIPLPHQIQALSRAISGDRVRYLLADEVGLGKTVEAGLIVRELKLRGLVKRVLVIAPKGLVTQWVAEMETHFREEFRLLIPSDFATYRRITRHDNIWRAWSQVVCPMDSVKPMESRRGWSRQQVDDYNRERFENLIAADWDIVIVDEAHRLGGSTVQVARYRLGQGLAEAAPYLLLLSATPHQGKADAFHRLISLVDEESFPDCDSVTRDRVQPFVIRTEKRHAIDADGKPLFKPRRTELASVSWGTRHQQHRALYEAVTEYVQLGYNQAIKEKKSYIGFLMILMQRLVVSSTHAIATTLQRRLDALQVPDEQLTLFPIEPTEWSELDGQEQIDMLLRSRLSALKDERQEVELLLRASRQCEQTAPDAKAEALLDWIYRLQAEEGEPELKVLVFTEFVPTQGMLASFLEDRGIAVTTLNGSMSMEDRWKAQEAFAKRARVLISTDAGGEGLNLQFCHVIVNYDLPWNPMRLEQRIGRVDRIGQTHVVRAINLLLEDSVEYRVQEVLQEKLAIIYEQFGIDKTGDVLDSGEAERLFEELYVDAILNPESIDATVSEVVEKIRNEVREVQEGAAVLAQTHDLDTSRAQDILNHPLPHWVECMTINFIRCHGGSVKRKGEGWLLTWPDGEVWAQSVFTERDIPQGSETRVLTLEEPRIRALAAQLPWYVAGMEIPAVIVDGVSDEVSGWWSLWSISLRTDAAVDCRVLPLFFHDDGRSLPPTARHIWDQLTTAPMRMRGCVGEQQADSALSRLRSLAETAGQAIYMELSQCHQGWIERERQKRETWFDARRSLASRIGLADVRNHRLKSIDAERHAWRSSSASDAAPVPEMSLLTVCRIGRRDEHA